MRHAPAGSFTVDRTLLTAPDETDTCLCYNPTLTAQKNPSA